MKISRLLTAILFVFISANAIQAQNIFSPRTGDKDLDLSLQNIEVKAKTDLPFFKQDLSINFGVPVPDIDKLLGSHHLHPAEVFLALQLAKLLNVKIDIVVGSYEKNKSKGWGAIAKDLGIKPGSAEFHALKNSAKGKNGKMKSKGKDKHHGNNTEGGHGNGHGNGHGHGKGKK